MIKRIASALKTTPLVLALVFSFGLSYAYASWTEPAGAPPSANADAPINAGATAQIKAGALTVGNPFAVIGGSPSGYGYAYAHDYYIASINKWASELGGGGGGTGITGILAPLKNMSIVCTTGYGGEQAFYYAKVDANGYPYVRAVIPGGINALNYYSTDSGWVLGFTTTIHQPDYPNGEQDITTTMDEFGVTGAHSGPFYGNTTSCHSQWPWE